MPQDPQDHDVAANTNKTYPSRGQIFSLLLVALKLEKFAQKKSCYDMPYQATITTWYMMKPQEIKQVLNDLTTDIDSIVDKKAVIVQTARKLKVNV